MRTLNRESRWDAFKSMVEVRLLRHAAAYSGYGASGVAFRPYNGYVQCYGFDQKHNHYEQLVRGFSHLSIYQSPTERILQA